MTVHLFKKIYIFKFYSEIVFLNVLKSEVGDFPVVLTAALILL